MMTRTYLQQCLKEGRLCRWPDGAMPLKVYIAPFTWYEKKKQQQANQYHQLILESLQTWRTISENRVRFTVVNRLADSQLDFKWRRVDRKSLGHCTYEIDSQSRIFTAEIQIGISDGLLHSAYENTGEVRHTVLHEIGHALGLLGHSDASDDIMYVPHQYGIHALTQRDIDTLNWLYKLPVGFRPDTAAERFGLPYGTALEDILRCIEQRRQGSFVGSAASSAPTPAPLPGKPAAKGMSLEEQHQILSNMGRFYIQTQNIYVPPITPAPPKKQS